LTVHCGLQNPLLGRYQIQTLCIPSNTTRKELRQDFEDMFKHFDHALLGLQYILWWCQEMQSVWIMLLTDCSKTGARQTSQLWNASPLRLLVIGTSDTVKPSKSGWFKLHSSRTKTGARRQTNPKYRQTNPKP